MLIFACSRSQPQLAFSKQSTLRRRRQVSRPLVARSCYRSSSRVNVPIGNVDKGSVTFVGEHSPANACYTVICSVALLVPGTWLFCSYNANVYRLWSFDKYPQIMFHRKIVYRSADLSRVQITSRLYRIKNIIKVSYIISQQDVNNSYKR